MEVGWPFTETAARGAGLFSRLKSGRRCGTASSRGRWGIIYFNHSFGGPNQSQHCLRVCPDTLGRITKFSKHEPN